MHKVPAYYNKAILYKYVFLLVLLLFSGQNAFSQKISSLGIDARQGLRVTSVTLSDSSILYLSNPRPLFSFNIKGKYFTSADFAASHKEGVFSQNVNNSVSVKANFPGVASNGFSGEIIFENTGSDTVTLSNIVPFGEDMSSVYITGYGPSDLARARLFRPGFEPLRVILPDNAWELGYSSFEAGNSISLCALTRRRNTEGAEKKRYETTMPPGSKVRYSFNADIFRGGWQEGLRLMFRDRYLYDLEKFDNTLYERQDLAWIRESYIIILSMAWDREFYNRKTGKYTYADLLKKGMEYFGNIDVFGIWPTWPRLGLDRRNQWDMYKDLPGGLTQIGNFVKMTHPYGTKFFIAYNPWDKSTRSEDHLRGMASVIKEIEADGVVLDIMGNSSREIQAAADSVRKGVIMYSEGMAVVKDMPGIISGRVHNAIYYSPELNLNKLIKPDFSIFRVCDVGEDVNHREIAIAFFNGYGTELNMFRPGGRDENYIKDLEFLASTTFILRQNNDAFLDQNWTPLIETSADKVYVNRWRSGEKSIYTVLNMRSEGISGEVFKIPAVKGKHYVSLWNHENITPGFSSSTASIYVEATGWPASATGTRKEGSVDCIAEFPVLLRSQISGDSLIIKSPGAGRVIIWKGDPSYKTSSREFRAPADTAVSVTDIFGYYEGKIVIQLLENKRLKDENILTLKGGKPWLVSRSSETVRAVGIPSGMVLVPGAVFSYGVTTREDFIPYPALKRDSVRVDSFLIDKYPVTNAQYYEFIISSGYMPSDTSRYLRHWESGTFRQGQDRYPVVNLSYEDMQAYARWAGKRLPTEDEWQLAAQGTDGRKWPWGNEFHATNCNNAFGRPTPVDAFPKSQSPYGVIDLVGNVWQITNDMYFNGTSYFTVIRGGSYFNPESSTWYIQGGPQPLDRTQIMLLVSPGFDRSETVGFRCVKDIDSRNFRVKR
ncbi:MAG TPA: SUMF1/EgtB/PvdO family nonheme iron enzyme [Bacteroidales bacterium]|nr:SUMF1/EgtB/PvdO family nonheme iron enzyme [Bacteroidales bacterium]HQK68757.1 SUMF1/EgtB/PvdO family nonheme iron enzyme [Bacteroidales bacterium]